MENATAQTPNASQKVKYNDKPRLVMTLDLVSGCPQLTISKGGSPVTVTKDVVLFDKMNENMEVEDSVTVKVKKHGGWTDVVVKSRQVGEKDWSEPWVSRAKTFTLAAGEGELPDTEFKVVATVEATSAPEDPKPGGGWKCSFNEHKKLRTWKLDPIVKIKRRGFTT